MIYLGSSVPFQDLVETNKMVQADYLFTAITTALSGEKLKAYLKQLSETFSKQTIFIAGLKIHEEEVPQPANVKKVSDPKPFNEWLKTL